MSEEQNLPTPEEDYQNQKIVEQEAIKDAFKVLIEHFDTVQLFVTRHEPVTESGTLEYIQGAGNYYARFGQVQMWLEKQRAEGTSESLNNMFDMITIFDEDDDSDEEIDEDDDEPEE